MVKYIMYPLSVWIVAVNFYYFGYRFFSLSWVFLWSNWWQIDSHSEMTGLKDGGLKKKRHGYKWQLQSLHEKFTLIPLLSTLTG